MTTFQKIIKYLALAFALFLSISIITGIKKMHEEGDCISDNEITIAF